MSGTDPWAEFIRPSAPPAGVDPWADFVAPTPQQWARDPRTGQPIPGLPAGAPVRSLRSASGPVADSLGLPVENGQQPGIGTQAAASMATDPEQKRRIYASRLFPGMPLQEALSRVSYQTGRLFAVGMDGRPFWVEPETPSLDLAAGEASGMSPSNIARFVGTAAGGALPAAGGIVGGLVAAPTSLVAGPAGAAAGAAAGDAARQMIARGLDPNPRATPYNPLQTAGEAALGGAGQLAGSTLARLAGPNPLAMSRPDQLALARNPQAAADATAAADTARSIGVDLTPGQASGMRSLLQYEDAAMLRPDTVDRAVGFYRQQGEQMQGAAGRMLSGISPNADPTDAALAFRQGAADTVQEVRQQANRAARPAYEAAQNAGQVVSPDLAALMDNPAVRQAMQQARETYSVFYGRQPPSTPDFALWDLTKQSLDDLHRQAGITGNNTLQTAYDRVRTNLRDRLDEAYPTYAEARATAAPGQRLAAQLDETATGRTADRGVDARTRSITAPLFEQSNPRAVEQARAAFEQAGRMDEWNAGVRAYLQDAINKASRSQEGLNASMLRRQIWANVDNVSALRAAMSPEQFAGFSRFMETVEKVARTFPMNSLTEARRQAGRALEGAATDEGVRAAQMASRATSPMRGLDAVGAIFDSVGERRIQSNISGIIDRIFSPDGVTFLQQMSSASPGSQRALSLTAQFLGQTGAAVLPTQPMPPPSRQAAPAPAAR